MNYRVAIESCRTYQRQEVDGAIEKALLPLGGLGALIRRGDRVVLKPNLLYALPADRAVTTHPVIVESVAAMALDCGAKVIIGDSPPLPNAQRVAKACGISEVAERLQIPIVDFHTPSNIPRKPPLHTAQIKIPYLEQTLLDADVVINLPKLKAHSQILMTCGVKNLFGCVTGRRKALWHFLLRKSREAFAEMLLAVYERVAPELTLVDAVTVMEGDGPVLGTPKPMGLILAGTQAVAVDRMVMEVLGVDWQQYSVLKMAKALGFPETDESRIECVGLPLTEVRLPQFQMPELQPIGFSIPHLIRGIMRHFSRKYFKTQFSHQ